MTGKDLENRMVIPGYEDLEMPDEDEAYERQRQEDIDDGDSLHNTLADIGRSAA